jgi:hypothetical protein
LQHYQQQQFGYQQQQWQQHQHQYPSATPSNHLPINSNYPQSPAVYTTQGYHHPPPGKQPVVIVDCKYTRIEGCTATAVNAPIGSSSKPPPGPVLSSSSQQSPYRHPNPAAIVPPQSPNSSAPVDNIYYQQQQVRSHSYDFFASIYSNNRFL